MFEMSSPANAYLLVVLASLACVDVDALDNGVGRTPALGYNTWNDFRCQGITAEHVLQVASKLSSLGLQDLGYTYVNIDDCWSRQRDPTTHKLIPDPAAFPNGMRNLSDTLARSGFKLGIYTDRGEYTCQHRPASLHHEKLDAQTFADWGISYVKEDSCYTIPVVHDIAFYEYGKMRDALNATGREILFSLCGWHSWYAPRGQSLGNSWRISGDVNGWASVYNAIRINEGLSQYAGPGGFNDPDMLVGSSTGAAAHITPTQSRTQFSLWAVMAAPLIIGSNVLNMSAWDLETYSNEKVIAINQDLLGKQATVIWSNCPKHKVAPPTVSPREEITIAVPDCQQVWAKPLSQTNTVATTLVNFAKTNATVICDGDCWDALHVGAAASVHDVWDQSNNDDHNVVSMLKVELQADGHSATYVLTGTDAVSR